MSTPDGSKPRPEEVRRSEGFPGQIMHVLPRPLLAREAAHFPVRELYVTSLGWYPRARRHERRRDQGAEQHILILCARGEGRFAIGGREDRLGPGEVLLIPRRMPHHYGAADTVPWSIHWAHFLGDDADYYIRLLPNHSCKLPVAKATSDRMARVFRDGYASVGRGYSGTTIRYLSHALRYLLGLLFFENPAYNSASLGPCRHDVNEWIDFMLEHIACSPSLSAMAHRAGLSVPQFATVFRQQAGMSPVSYFIHLKVQRACTLLDTTPLSIGEVGQAVGYDDPYYFSRVFRRVMGVSPQEFRRRQFE